MNENKRNQLSSTIKKSTHRLASCSSQQKSCVERPSELFQGKENKIIPDVDSHNSRKQEMTDSVGNPDSKKTRMDAYGRNPKAGDQDVQISHFKVQS